MGIHDFDKKLQQYENRIKDSTIILEENKRIIFKFKRYCFANDLSVPRVVKLIEHLTILAERTDKPLTEWNREDVEVVLEWVDERVRKEGLSPWTKREYKKTLKKFFKWLGKKELVDWFTIGEVKARKFPDELLTEDEIIRMLEACKNPRDRALIATLWESGCRVGELGNMRVRDVELTDEGAWVKLFGKTGERSLLLPFSTIYLSEWLKAHPDPQPDNWLWVTLGRENYGSQMDYGAIRMLLKKVAKRARVSKKVHPHLFRHTRATELAKAGWSEVEMCLYMGWEIGSKMPRIYIHMVGRDIKRRIKELHGLAEPEEQERKLKAVKCPRCFKLVSSIDNFCPGCGYPLTSEAAMKMQEWNMRKARVMNEVALDPGFMAYVASLEREIRELKIVFEKYVKNK